MKFALISDNTLSVESYYIENNKVFKLDRTPYYRSQHIENECMMGFWNYPALFDGYFINLKQGLPTDIQFDLIFVAIESDLRNLEKIRKLNPEALIVGTIKEYKKNIELRNDLIDQTDAFVVPYLFHNFFDEQNLNLPKHLYRIPQPINISYLRKNFLSSKEDIIFEYTNFWAQKRQGPSDIFLNSISYKNKSGRDDVWNNFIDKWKNSKFMLNLDPTFNYGQQATQCAALETIMLGGNNDANKILYPTLASMDLDYLKSEFYKLITDEEYYNKTKNYALETLESLYSFSSVSSSIKNLYNEFKN